MSRLLLQKTPCFSVGMNAILSTRDLLLSLQISVQKIPSSKEFSCIQKSKQTMHLKNADNCILDDHQDFPNLEALVHGKLKDFLIVGNLWISPISA